MPSGAKKRKAAKRKKELGAIHLDSSPPTNNNLQGNGGRHDDDLISHQGRGSESGDFPSPTSQDNRSLEAVEETEDEGEETEDEAEEKKRKDRDSTESGGVGKVMDSSENGGRKTGESLPHHKPEEEVAGAAAELKGEDILPPPPPPSPPLPPKSAAIPISEPEVVYVEHAQSEEGEDVGGSGEDLPPVEVPTGRVLEKSVAATDLIVHSVSISEEVVRISDATVENLEISSVAESPSDRYEEKVVPWTDDVSEQPRGSAESCPDTESREITGATEPQVVLSIHSEHRASWMNCCGLFDALMGSRR